MLGHCEQMPERIGFRGHRGLGVFPEIAEQVFFKLTIGTAQPHEGCFQAAAGIGQSPEDKRGPVSVDVGIPGAAEQLFL